LQHDLAAIYIGGNLPPQLWQSNPMPMWRAPKSSVAPKLQQHATRARSGYSSTELYNRSETTSFHRFESRSDAACAQISAFRFLNPS
jgi:hypothetical protein